MKKKYFFTIFVYLIFIPLHSIPSFALSADSYETDNTYEDAKKIIINDTTSQHHNFHNVEDEDWVKFIGFAGNSYTIKAVNKGDGNLVIELYDTNDMSKHYLLQNTPVDEVANEELYFNNCPHDGVWAAKIKLYESSPFTENMDYDLKVFLQIGPMLGTIQGIVKDAVTLGVIPDAIITTNKKRGDFSSLDDGTYRMMDHPFGDFELKSEAIGYEPCLYLGALPEGGVIEKDIEIIPQNLSAVLFMLQIIAGKNPSESFCWQDTINNDGKISLEDVIFKLQKVGGLR